MSTLPMTTFDITRGVYLLSEQPGTLEWGQKVDEMEGNWKQFLIETTGEGLSEEVANLTFRKAYEHHAGNDYYAMEDTFALLVGYHNLLAFQFRK